MTLPPVIFASAEFVSEYNIAYCRGWFALLYFIYIIFLVRSNYVYGLFDCLIFRRRYCFIFFIRKFLFSVNWGHLPYDILPGGCYLLPLVGCNFLFCNKFRRVNRSLELIILCISDHCFRLINIFYGRVFTKYHEKYSLVAIHTSSMYLHINILY